MFLITIIMIIKHISHNIIIICICIADRAADNREIADIGVLNKRRKGCFSRRNQTAGIDKIAGQRMIQPDCTVSACRADRAIGIIQTFAREAATSTFCSAPPTPRSLLPAVCSCLALSRQAADPIAEMRLYC